ncbi:hypothetical protein GGR54DRAFT_364754 [Hypoxylon sp. NC1633]|nr:hypothetical protein GGR54DRAFT_364754 [Hypoxylon sp. NC1633]
MSQQQQQQQQQRPDYRRAASDASSFYSVRSGSVDSAYSVWSSSESDSFVYREDPDGWFYGVDGAVTRFVDERDDRRRRFAAHILSGPFAQFYKRHRANHSTSHARPGRTSAPGSRSSSRSSTNSVSPGRAQHHHFQPRPVSAGPPPPPPQQFHPQQGFHPHQGFHGPPPPPPPPPPAAGAGAGPDVFQNGFIQLGGPAQPAGPADFDDDPWGEHAGYGHEGQFYG